ncbi:MAG TPA: hypothetical protein VGD74_08015, partial [Vulgatibacter sp.]
MSAHPSFRELDRIAMGDRLPEASAHARDCAACSAHLERLRHVEAPPAALRDAAGARAGSGRKRLPAWWGWAAAPALAAAVATVWFAGPPEPAPPGQAWLATKGGPSFAIFVKRGDDLVLWDGASPLVAGDRIRVRVAPKEFTHVAVGARDASGAWSVLYRGELGPGAEVLLPGSWEVDAS